MILCEQLIHINESDQPPTTGSAGLSLLQVSAAVSVIMRTPHGIFGGYKKNAKECINLHSYFSSRLHKHK
jgi:hypothetical protein